MTVGEPVKIPGSKSLKNIDLVVFSRPGLLSGLLSYLCYLDDGKSVRNKHAYQLPYVNQDRELHLLVGAPYTGVQKYLACLL